MRHVSFICDVTHSCASCANENHTPKSRVVANNKVHIHSQGAYASKCWHISKTKMHIQIAKGSSKKNIYIYIIFFRVQAAATRTNISKSKMHIQSAKGSGKKIIYMYTYFFELRQSQLAQIFQSLKCIFKVQRAPAKTIYIYIHVFSSCGSRNLHKYFKV